MVCTTSLRIVTVTFHAVVSLPLIALAARFGPVCDRTVYGLPSYRACDALLFDDGGISSIDAVEHGFLLPSFAQSSQFTYQQWKNRVSLPEIWRNGRFSISRMSVECTEYVCGGRNSLRGV